MASESSHKKNQHKPLKMIAKFFNKGKIMIHNSDTVLFIHSKVCVNMKEIINVFFAMSLVIFYKKTIK